RKMSSALLVGVLLLLLNFAPSPTYVQYFSTSIPFLLSGSAELWHLSTWEVSHPFGTVTAAVTIICPRGILLLCLRSVPTYIYTHTVSWIGVTGIERPEAAVSWNLSAIRAVSREVNELTVPGEPVLVIWPGYLLETHAAPFPGMENRFGMKGARVLSKRER